MGIEKFKHGQISGEGLSSEDKEIANNNLRFNRVINDAVSLRFGSGNPQPKDEEMFKKIYNLSLKSAIKWAEKNKKGEMSESDKFFVLQTIMESAEKLKKTVH